MNRLLGKPVEFLHRLAHSRSWIRRTADDQRLASDSGAFEGYIDYFHHNCRDTITWMGKHADKFPSDAWVYQEIIHETRPDVIVEIGNWAGGSALFLANILDLLGNGKVIAVDIDHSKIDFEHPRISWITGDATSKKVLSKVDSLIHKGEKVMVIEDSSHTYDNTLAVLRNYSRYVKPGMYFIVEDGVCRYPFIEDGPKPGPTEAIHKFLEENRDFVIDKSREKFTITYNPEGYLRRVK